ncbi:MAG: YbaN family protein [Phycisphaerales bacterium]|nr:YbaN family protein [Phycisphaerales bacterium]
MPSLLKPFLIALGSLCVALAVLGIFLPLLPTTPFLLLAALCFARSSPRLLNWLLTNRWFGSYIKNYREGRGIPRREKILTLTALWLTIALSILFAVSLWWVALLLILIALSVTVHLLLIPTYKPPPQPPDSINSGDDHDNADA